MCGIFAIVLFKDSLNAQNNLEFENRSVVFSVIDGLKKLEYRGYDSAGVGFLTQDSGNLKLNIIKRSGKIRELEKHCRKNVSRETFLESNICIGHTRWATHGEPSTINAHPIKSSENFAVVMNGIVENFNQLKSSLENKGYEFQTSTDTEVIAVLIQHYYNSSKNVHSALQQAFNSLKGNFAYIVISNIDREVYCCRKGAPIIIGKSNERFIVSSDSIALSEIASEIHNLQDGAIVKLSENAEISYILQPKDSDNIGEHVVEIKFEKFEQNSLQYDKGGFSHFMLKEIHENTEVVQRILNTHASNYNTLLPNIPNEVFNVSEVVIVGCGTSYHAGLAIKYILEQHSKIRSTVHIASEFRYQPLTFSKNSIFIFISQSGETADTLSALEYVKRNGFNTLSFVNVLESSIARKSNNVVDIMAGPEIGVASTKAFVAQYVCLLLFALRFGVLHETIGTEQVTKILTELQFAERAMHKFLENSNIEGISENLAQASLILFTGRGVAFPLALEGALKFKEITYKLSEGLPAGELKHGPIALIDSKVWVIAINPSNKLSAKTISNVHEMKSRKAKILMLSTKETINSNKNIINASIEIPESSDFVVSVLYAVPLQLIAYYAAKSLDLEIDQPRNLAKSVTVE